MCIATQVHDGDEELAYPSPRSREWRDLANDKIYRRSMASMQSDPESGSVMSYEQFRFNSTFKEDGGFNLRPMNAGSDFFGTVHESAKPSENNTIVIPQVQYQMMPFHSIDTPVSRKLESSGKKKPLMGIDRFKPALLVKEPTFIPLQEMAI